MNKVYGFKKEFTPIRSDRSRLIVSYDMQPTEDNVHATWCEIYFYKKPHPYVSDEEIKTAILDDINSQTDEKILKGFEWNKKPVWLSSENQFNFKAAYDLAIQTQGQNLPLKFKLGEVEVEIGKDKYGIPIREKQPVYHTFETVEEFTDFYTKAILHINKCLNKGWKLKDNINWNDYKVN